MSAVHDPPNGTSQKDWFARPQSAFLLWCVPLLFGFGASLLGSPLATALVWMAAFLWMGAGCIVNALRCQRLHCYISGPVFLIGAAALGLLAANLLSLGPHALNNIIGVTLVLAGLSFLPEIVWRKYA